MNKILKILSILVIGFVMFSCSTPTNDPTHYVPEESGPETPAPNPAEPSGPETPVETPSDNPVEETPKVQTYSITFVAGNSSVGDIDGHIADTLNKKPDFKNIEEGTEVMFPEWIYVETEEWNAEIKVRYYYEGQLSYGPLNKIESTVMDSDKNIIVVYKDAREV